MTPFLPLLNSAGAQTAGAAKQKTANFASSHADAVSAQVRETTSSGIFPVEVAFVVLGCLMVTGLLLMMRESRIEKQDF